MRNKWYHIIGVSGVATSALAVLLKNLGFTVTGSDENIYSPAKDILDANEIEYKIGHSYENLIQDNDMPDEVILAGGKLAKNREVLFAKKNNIPIKSYPEILKEFVVKEDSSIVVTGTYGKTSITSMLVYLFENLGIETSFMVGGFSESLTNTIKSKNENTKYSIIEGDEYLSSKLDTRSKFFYYSPEFLVINSVEWDHTDLFKTQEDYILNFKKLAEQVPASGVIFANNSENIDRVVSNIKCKVIRFDYDSYRFDSNMVGRFNSENAAFAVQIAFNILEKEFNVTVEKLQNILKEFKGIKRRMEVRFRDEDVIVVDDFGSSPSKAKGAIRSIKESFPDHELFVVYEPNEGARTEESLGLYDDAFIGTDKIILPPFREMKDRITETDLEAYLSTLDCGNMVKTMSADKIVENILEEITNKTVILFLGSHDFEYLISDLVQKLK